MARKKRLQEVSQTPEEKPKEPVFYQDAFQEKANKQITELSKKVEGKGKTVLYAIGAVVVAGILIALVYTWNSRSGGAAQAALGRAIETSISPVTSQPLPPTYKGKAFKTERERAEAAAAEFKKVAETYSGDVREQANYFAAVNRLSFDRAAAVTELEGLSKGSGVVATLSKFALGQAKQGDGKLDEATAIYQSLLEASDSVVSKESINMALASVYEKQGKQTEAVDIYFKIAERSATLKDSAGKPVPPTQTARDAKTKLQTLDPAKAAQIKEPSQLPS